MAEEGAADRGACTINYIIEPTVRAEYGGIAALGDVSIHRAEPCTSCEVRFVREPGDICRHCHQELVVMQIKEVVGMAFISWLMSAGMCASSLGVEASTALWLGVLPASLVMGAWVWARGIHRGVGEWFRSNYRGATCNDYQ